MSDKKLGKQQRNAGRSTKPSGKDVPGKSLSQVSTSILTSRVLSEHKHTVGQPKAVPPKQTLRQLIVSIHSKTNPKESQKLPHEELSRLVRSGNVFQRRLRRLVLSGRRYIDLEPMLPLQEAIALELSKQLGCLTRFYKGLNDSRYMVVYKPGVEPNPFELRARRMCQKDKGQEIYVVKEDIEDNRMEPMSFRNGKLHWHQPMEWGDRRRAADP